MARTKRGRRRRSVLSRLARSPRVRLLVGLSLGYTIALNLFVRQVGGGDALPLSVSHLPDKSLAALQLMLHLPTHLWRDHGDVRSGVRSAARAHGVAAAWVLATARAESSLRPHAISHTGAMGVMQLMPGTARQLQVADPFDPKQSATGGARYLAQLLKRYAGDRRRATAAYNLGPGRVPRHGALQLPAETRHYVRRVLGRSTRPTPGPIAGR